MKKSSQLSWIQQDYLEDGQEVPDCLINDHVHTEGELMGRDEIDSWIADSATTFCLIRERDENRFEELYKGYVADVDYLQSLGKISHEEAEDIKNKDLYKFDS